MKRKERLVRRNVEKRRRQAIFETNYRLIMEELHNPLWDPPIRHRPRLVWGKR